MVILIDQITYKTKKQLTEKVRTILNEMKNNNISEININSVYFNFWKCLFNRHPTKGHFKPISFTFEKPCHMYFNTDEKQDSFSWKVCISQKEGSKKSDYFACLRSSIEPQIEQFKMKTNHICACCKKTNCYYEVDHIISFSDIYKNFEKTVENLSENDTKIYYDSKKHRQFFDLSDEYTKSLNDLWFDYHKENATFQKLCKDCHILKTQKNTTFKK